MVQEPKHNLYYKEAVEETMGHLQQVQQYQQMQGEQERVARELEQHTQISEVC